MSMKIRENKFPFGNKFGWWEYQSEYTDFWRWYFNFGFITNEIKWAAVEQSEGVRDYTKADELRQQFADWGVPVSGNTVFWEAPRVNTR